MKISILWVKKFVYLWCESISVSHGIYDVTSPYAFFKVSPKVFFY